MNYLIPLLLLTLTTCGEGREGFITLASEKVWTSP